MNNEPVAWMQVSAIDGTPMKASLVQTWEDDIPLYTHPAKTQEPDCYGDGNVYRGVRSKDSETKTYVFDEHAGKQVWSNPAKTLTDAEINELAENTLPNQAIGYVPSWQWIEFARAILRKAQEK